jgi:CHAT domain-containing protein
LAKALAARHLDTAAEAEFARAFATIEVGRAQLKQDESRLGFVATLRRFYDDYVGFIVQRGRVRTALEVADRSRARLLTERLGRDPLTQLVSATDLQQLARQLEATLVSYWLAPEQSYAWIVSADSIELHRLPERAELCRRVDAYQAWINGSRDPIHEESAAGQDLYADLLGPLAGRGARGSRVVLALDECLHHLNFESLVVPKPVPHYWLDDVRVEIAPALGLLAESVSGVRARKDLGLLAFGDPLASGDEFPRLPQAAREIAGITHAFPPEATAVYTGADANPGAWRAAHPERFAYIHFAAHATANRDSPLDSAIVLSPKGDDYKLYARDILDIPLHAELVTLSACRSAGARAYAGEGLVGLAWAFLSAGAQRVVGGLWNVEDASTAQLMERMYRGLRAGQSPAEALRAAKLELLHSDTAYRKPFYWAPFVVYTRTGQN